jgi:hypothetical protein
MKNNLSIEELLEFETSLIEKWENHVFSPMRIDEKFNVVLTNDLEIKELLEFSFKEHFHIIYQTIAIDYNAFKIIQLRYFRNNDTVQIIT